MKRLPLPELALFAMTIVWGYSFPAIKWALEGCGTMSLTGWRNLAGLLALLAVSPRALVATRLEWKIGLVGGTILAAGYVLETKGMETAAAGKSGFLAQFYVALVPLLQAAVFRRRPAWIDLGSLVLATTGIAVMVVRPGQDVSRGELLVALGALAWTVQIVMIGRVAERTDPIRLAAIQTGVIGAVGFVALPFADEAPVRWSAPLVGHILALGVGASALGFLVQAWAQKTVNPTRTAILFSAQPIFALVFSVWLAGETFDGLDVAGSALIMAAVAMAVLVPRNDARDSARG